MAGTRQQSAGHFLEHAMELKDLQNIFPFRTALRVHEFCDAFGIKTTLFYSLVKTGALRTRKIGKVTVIPLPEIVAWMRRPAEDIDMQDAI